MALTAREQDLEERRLDNEQRRLAREERPQRQPLLPQRRAAADDFSDVPPGCNLSTRELIGKEVSTQLHCKDDAEYSVIMDEGAVKRHLLEDCCGQMLHTNISSEEEFDDMWCAPRHRVKHLSGGMYQMANAFKNQSAKKANVALTSYDKVLNIEWCDTKSASDQEKQNFKAKATALAAEKDGIGFRSVAEPFDREPFMVALAAAWDKRKQNKKGDGFLPNKSPVKVTIEQAAFSSFKLSNRLADPLQEGQDVGSRHLSGVKAEVAKLRAELETTPSTKVTIIDHGLEY